MRRLAMALGLAAGLGAMALGMWPRAAHAWWWSSTYTATNHPIVLAHGAAGFDDLFGVYDYFYAIPADLAADGATVFVTQVPAFGSTAARGEVLRDQIEDILALTGEAKVNLIGHSHGGLDARYVASTAPHLVASVSTVGSPHQGAELADLLSNNTTSGGFSQTVLSLFANSLGDVLALISGDFGTPQDSIGTLNALTSSGLATFNAAHPAGLPTTPCGDGPAVVGGIRYYSWSGDRTATNLLDPSDPLLVLTGLVYTENNDGLVGVCSSHLGDVIRDDYDQNHLDEVNQVFGLTYLFGSNPKSIFRTHANRLKNAGL